MDDRASRIEALHVLTDEEAANAAEDGGLRAGAELGNAIAVGLLAEPLGLTADEAHEIGSRISRPALTMVIAALMDTVDMALLVRRP